MIDAQLCTAMKPRETSANSGASLEKMPPAYPFGIAAYSAASALPAPETEAALGRNPSVGLFDLVVALERGLEGEVRLDRGAGRGYCVRLRSARSA